MSETLQLFESLDGQFADLPALVDIRQTFSYSKYFQRAAQVASNLKDAGLRPGDRLAIIGSNSIDYALLVMGAIQAGVVAAPLSTRLPTEAIAMQLNQIDASHLVILNGDMTAAGFDSVNVHSAEELLAENTTKSRMSLPSKQSANQLATMIFTSGSSGNPKAALHTLGNHYYSALGVNQALRFETGSRWLQILPLCHVGGLGILFRAIIAHGTVVFHDSSQSIVESLVDNRITHLSIVSTQAQRLFEELTIHRTQFPFLKAILLGGSALSDRLIQSLLSLGLPVFTSYGLTEMTSTATITSGSDTKIGSSGKVLSYRELKIDANSEILTRGQTLFAGYCKGKSVRKPVDDGGWYHTGDMGKLDSSGDLIVTGRKDNLFISGGENIYPEEIERALSTIEGIVEAVVVPVSDTQFGFRPVALIRLFNSSDHVLIDSLIPRIRATLANILPRFKIPSAFFLLPDNVDLSSPGIKRDRKALQKYAEAQMAKSIRSSE
ncbi:MAG: o-succinylbenzoate--CoA ligase [candidate division Zixibacteria bacterium]|nr:o-succinylbenzoate--CoA ligase [candidate division Zixibacteria bacterium]